MLFPASKLGDIIIGVDAHTIVLPVGPPVPLVPHPFIGNIFIWWTPQFPSFNVFVNGTPALTLGAKSISFHIPTPPGVWWVKLPCPAKFFITHYTTVLLSALFSTVLGTVGAMTGTSVPTTRTPRSEMNPPPDNPTLWAALQGQISSFSWMSILRMLLPPVVLPIAEGDVNMASPTVTVNGGPMSFVGPLFAGSCSEIPIIPNANILGFSNVMVGVTLKEILIQLAWNVVHGLANLAASKLGAKFGSWASGEPVDMVSGSVWVKQTDFKVPGPIPVEFTRSYINCVNEFGPLGYNWTHTYNQFLKIENDGAIFYYNEQGRPVRLPQIPVGGVHQSLSESLTLDHPDRDTYRLRTREKRLLTFRLTTLEPIARLVSIADESGNSIQLEYTGSRLVRLIDSVNRRFTFLYDPYGRLTEIRFSGRGSQLADWTMASFEYDQQNNLTAVFDRANHARRFLYNEHHWMVQHTTRTGFSVFYEYDNLGQCVRTWADDNKYGGTAEYLTASRITRWTNTRNHTWTYFYNEQNLVTQIIDPLGHAKKMEWNEQGLLVSSTDEEGFTTTFDYDDRGNCVKMTDAGGGVTSQSFNENGDRVELTNAEGSSIRREFDEHGRLASQVDAFGLRWEHSYSVRGLVHRITAPDGSFRQEAYSEDWSALEVSDQDGIYMSQEFDLLGNRIALTDALGTRYQFWHTPQGWVEEIIGPDGTMGRYTYDADGNPTSFTDATGKVSRAEFRGLHRAVAAQTGNGDARFWAPEPVEEKLASVTDASGQSIRITYDACERLQRQEYFDGRWAECQYDGRGLLKKIVFSSGLTFSFTHDELRRTTRWEASDGTFVNYTYDKLGRCVRAENALGGVEYRYDAAWRVVEERQADVVIGYEYDMHGNLAARANSATGRRIAFTYGSDDQIKSVADGNGGGQEISTLTGGATVRRFSNGVEERIAHDRYGRMHRQTVMNRAGSVLIDREYGYDLAGRLTDLRDLWRGKLSFDYDDGSRLLQVARDGIPTERFAYDPNNNISNSAALGAFLYAAGNRILQAGPVRFTHDTDGNVTEISDDRTHTRLIYDCLGRIIRSTAPNGTVTEYGYDAIGRRIFKRTGDSETRYYWQDFAPMIEDSGDGNPIEYVVLPGSFKPLMMWKGGTLHHYVFDQIGTVQEIVGPTGAIYWQGRFSAWGELLQTSVARLENNLRFPGQYYDRETGLHYNGNRYYDPRSARYVTPDPAGLGAGLNLYHYCVNPIGDADPMGLGESRSPASPNTDITDRHNAGEFGTTCAICGAKTHGPGGPNVPSSPDHIEPYSWIKDMPGYDQLSQDNKRIIQNDPDNFVTLCRPCNQSRGNKPYGTGPGEFQGRNGQTPNPDVADALAARQADMRGRLEKQIQDMLKEQAEAEAAAKAKPNCG